MLRLMAWLALTAWLSMGAAMAVFVYLHPVNTNKEEPNRGLRED